MNYYFYLLALAEQNKWIYLYPATELGKGAALKSFRHYIEKARQYRSKVLAP